MIQSRQRFFTALFWGFFALRYFLLEARAPRCEVIDVFCPLDERIPFREGFLVFYVAWYILLIGMHLYTRKADSIVFLQYSRFLVFAFTLSSVCFLAFPSCQNLRPDTYPRDNLLTRAVMLLHALDTNTNVCPSEHVLGTLGVLAAALHCGAIPKTGKLSIIFLSFGICLSTVFLKQHSVIDIAAAVPVFLVSYHFSFKKSPYPPEHAPEKCPDLP